MNRPFYALAALVVLAIYLSFAGCKPANTPRVVLYASIDPAAIKPILEEFTQKTGIRVDLVGDTEATKTTGLVNRLIAEKATPRADVWWSGEAVGTQQLAKAGVLAPYTSESAETTARVSSLGGWPIRSRTGLWYGHALRPRVIVYSTKVWPTPDAAPRSIESLARAAKPVAVANPAFGTTRGHFAALYDIIGRDDFTSSMSAVKWRVYDSNSTVVRAVANGECDAGLTDYDDYLAGLKNNWPLGVTYPGIPGAANPNAPVCTPATIGLVTGAPNPEHAKAFIDHVLSIATEQAMANGAWASLPVLPAATPPDDRFKGLVPARIDWESAAESIEHAARAWEQVINPPKTK